MMELTWATWLFLWVGGVWLAFGVGGGGIGAFMILHRARGAMPMWSETVATPPHRCDCGRLHQGVTRRQVGFLAWWAIFQALPMLLAVVAVGYRIYVQTTNSQGWIEHSWLLPVLVAVAALIAVGVFTRSLWLPGLRHRFEPLRRPVATVAPPAEPTVTLVDATPPSQVHEYGEWSGEQHWSGNGLR